MTEPTIKCPECGAEIKLTESLAAPLVANTRRHYERLLGEKDKDIAEREKHIREKEKYLIDEKKVIDATIADKVAEQLKTDRVKIAAEEAKKANLAAATDLEQKTKDIADLQGILKQRDVKLAEAQKAQAELLRKQRELDDAKRELELTVEKRVQKGIDAAREQAKKEAEENLQLKVKEKEQTIASMQKQIEELKRKAEQGSQQLQGEVQELEIEALLKAKFPLDTIEPVPKGEHGGDTLQRVVGSLGQSCGTILWESKRTKNWSDGWLTKLRDDQRAAKAEISVIVSQALPKGVEVFDQIDGVWVTHPSVFVPVALMLRQTLIEVSTARQASVGQQTKMEMLYGYLTGMHFRQRIQAIVEAFTTMKEDLDREKKVITKQWEKRDKQIERVMQSTVGMYGDLQGIAGKSLPEIAALEVEALEAPNINSDDTP
ncbi:MAG: DUF2130 domain-containing protein [Pseudomonadota bacterium]